METVASVETLKNEILQKNLSIKNVLQRIQAPETTESTILLLNSEYRADFKHLKQLIENFERFVRENCEDGDFKEDMELYKSQLTSLQTYFRKVNIQAQLNTNLHNKNELFYSESSNVELRSRHDRSKEELIKMTTNTTSKLFQVTQEVANIVDQSKNTLDVLAQSSQVVTETQEEYKVMGSVIASTKKLVSRYGRRETADLILILLALCLFFAACVYVIQKRMF